MELDDLQSRFNVSRETLERIEIYGDLLGKWNPKINLVSKSTIDTMYKRHFADSMQIFQLAPKCKIWADIGSGAGFPGLVCAIMAAERNLGCEFHLVESDTRKCAFLRNVSRETNVPVTIHNKRIEDVMDLQADVVSARALAPLQHLLEYAQGIAHSDAIGLYLKGQSSQDEIDEASRHWRFEHEVFPSLTSKDGAVLKISNLQRPSNESSRP